MRLPTIRRTPAERAEIEAPTASTLERFRAVSRWTSIASIVVGYHVLLGHVFGIDLLRSPAPGIPSMTPSAALCTVTAGAAVYLLQRPHIWAQRTQAYLLQACVGATATLAVLGVAENIGQGDLGFERWTGMTSMTLMTALAFLAIGAGLLLVDCAREYRVAEVLGLASAAISLQAIVGYVYGAAPFPGQMPLYTAVSALLVSTGLICVRADQGFMAKVASNSLGGVMARRLLPATLIVPILLGWLQERGQSAGIYDFEPGLAFFAIANVAVFVSVMWWGVNSLYRMDTKRRQAERELKETAAKLRRSNADLEQFAYVTSHDLKEPLRAISGSVQVLQSRFGEALGAEAEESIRHTVDGANRMQTLIDDLLTYSRLTSREAPLEPTNCDDVLGEALANLEVPLKESRAVVTHDHLPVVRADRTQLLQVFQNLVSNALKYRSERTPKIHVSAEHRGDEWMFSVRDNGIGIAPQYADRIFKIFQRLHTRKDYPGTGIGLAVCKTVVERHGGRIWVESEPEEGSTFYFTLPQ
ncbi:MAG: ATP-binding protein [Pseudomonadota bacterium]|nr:ATP-binding protein [Pseudomonadota bacterium]